MIDPIWKTPYAPGLIWTQGPVRRKCLQEWFAGREIPEYVWELREQNERQGGSKSGPLRSYWLETADDAVRYALATGGNLSGANLRGDREWDGRRLEVRARPQGTRLPGVPGMVEQAEYVVGYPPSARLEPARFPEVGNAADFVDPVTGLVPVAVIVKVSTQHA